MTEKVLMIIEKGDYKVPYVLFRNYKKLDLSEVDLLTLIYLMNEETTFNPKKMREELDRSMAEVLEVVDHLCSKDFIELKMKQGPIKEEYISLDPLYKKLAYFVTSKEVTPKEEKKSNIYDHFEQEFSRTLSPIEYELITGWLEAGFSEEIILLALKEAVYNGATNLRYVDKVLYEWKKKGIHNKEAYEKDKEKFQQSKKEARPKKELLDYDWLNDDK